MVFVLFTSQFALAVFSLKHLKSVMESSQDANDSGVLDLCEVTVFSQ